LLPSNANFSSINTSSLNVNNDVIIGGTTYLTDLIVSDVINCSTIQANNLSTAEMQFGNKLSYDGVTNTLSVNTTDTISSGNTLPITSAAVYNSLNTSPITISTIWSYMLSEPEFVLVASSVSAGGENTICYLDITPQYEGSKIHVEFCFSYSVGGFGTDSIVTEIRIGRNNNTSQSVIQEIFQDWTNGQGGGTRSGAGGTISASYTNTDDIGKYHRIQLRVDNNSDDSWSLDNSAFVSIKVIEFIETTGTSNPNILIGSGNISCGNLSCNTITATNHTIDNLITTENVNVGGSMVTVGFPESGVIVPSSMVRLAGGSAVQNWADMAWDGSTFNISTRQASKNFKVSFGQICHFEVDETNVSVQSLRVNQTLEVLGSLIYDDLVLNDSLLVQGDLLASNATFDNDVVFERDVDIEQTLNVSNINVSGNVVVAGTITGSNISTAALIPGTNITIVNDVISAFVESDADIVVSSLHVDNDVEIFGNINVSETSTFEQSLNVQNQLFVGDAGNTDGHLVLYSTNIGDNFQIQNGVTETSFLGTGNISRFNFSLLGNQTLTVSPTEVNISGILNIDNLSMNASLNVPEISTSEINLSDSTSIGQFTQINRQANRTFFVGNTGTGLGCDYVFYPSTQDGSVALEINRDLTTTAYRLNVATRMESVNICTDNNISCTGSMTIGGDLSVSGTIEGNLILDTLNVSEINNSTINTITANISGDVNVSGLLYVDQTAIFEDNIQMYGDFITLGDPEGGTDTELFLYSNTVGDSLRMAHVSETEFIFKLSDTNENMNFLIANASILTLDNSQARFHKNVNLSYTLSATVLNADDCNIELINASNLSADIGEITNLFGSNFSATDMNCSTLRADDFINNTEMVSPLINASTINSSAMTIKGNVNISGILSADQIDGVDLLNICSTNISTTNLSSTQTTSQNINCSTFTLIDTAGAGGLDVTGVGYFRTGLFAYNPVYLEGDDNYFGEPAGTSTRSRINFWSQKVSTEVGIRFGCDTDDIVRLNLPRFGLYTHYNINISNTSTMDMDNTSTKFHQNVNISGTLSADTIALSTLNCSFLDVINASVSNDLDVDGVIDCFDLLSDTATITTLNSTTMNASTINASTINGANLSTASMLFNSDFQFSLNTLSLASGQTATAIQSATLATLATRVDSLFGNFSTFNAAFGTVAAVLNMQFANTSQINASNVIGINVSSTNFSGVNMSATTQTLSNKLVVSNLTTSTTQATIGFLDIDTRFANSVQLGHKNFPGTSDYCLSISATGSTYFNCPSSANVHFAHGGTECFRIPSGSNLSMASGKSILASKTSSTNISNTNLSSVNISATSITAPNVQPIITDGDLTIARTNGLQTALDSKQATITDGSLTIARTNGLQTALDGKQATIADGDLTIAKTSGLQTALDGKQATIADGDLTIAKTNGLQTALDSKEPTITSATDLTINSLTTTNISTTNLSATEISTASATMGSNTLTMASDKYLESISNYAYYYKSANSAMTGTTHLVEFNSNTLQSALVTKTSNSRYTINRAGYYLVTASIHPENLSINDRVCYRAMFLKNGVANDAWSGDGFCYTREDDFGEFGTCANNRIISLAVDDYIEVQITCKIGSEGLFVSDLTGSLARRRSGLSFQYLGS
jgi:trimeric autotransporter adhesin